MAVAVSFSVTPTAPNHGDTVTATYTVTGNNPGPSQSGTVSGVANVGGTGYQVSTTITLPGTPALPVTYTTPTCTGLTFAATGTAGVFTAVVP